MFFPLCYRGQEDVESSRLLCCPFLRQAEFCHLTTWYSTFTNEAESGATDLRQSFSGVARRDSVSSRYYQICTTTSYREDSSSLHHHPSPGLPLPHSSMNSNICLSQLNAILILTGLVSIIVLSIFIITRQHRSITYLTSFFRAYNRNLIDSGIEDLPHAEDRELPTTRKESITSLKLRTGFSRPLFSSVLRSLTVPRWDSRLSGVYDSPREPPRRV